MAIEENSAAWREKLHGVLLAAVVGLDPADRAERVRQCRATGQHAITAHPAPAVITFEWGGRLLATVERAWLADDEAEPPRAEWINTDAPDTVPAEWSAE